MTDITKNGSAPLGAPGHQGIAEVVAKGLKKRYAAERRFRMYGLVAIGLALLILLVLFTTIISNGIGAFFQSKVTLDVPLEVSEIDPDQTGDLDVIGKANYRGLVFGSLRADFPGVSGRSNRRALTGLLSSGSDFELRSIVLDNPDLIGTTVQAQVSLSDDADMFLKGNMTDVEVSAGDGTLAMTEDGVLSGGVYAFGNVFIDVKAEFARKADEAENSIAQNQRQLGRIDEELAVTASRLENADDEAQKTTYADTLRNLETLKANVNASLEKLTSDATDFRTRSQSDAGEETLDQSMPSYLVVTNDGVFKILTVTRDKVTTEIVSPPSSLDSSADWQIVKLQTPETDRRLTDKQIGWLHLMQDRGQIESAINSAFFTTGDSREPELAGIWGAAVGSFWTLMVTLVLSFPIGVMAAVYLEEFAPKNKWTDLIEVNINNLAAVPSIVFGLLGLAVFLNVFGLPRSAPVVGGLVLTLMTLPTIIIASRAALKSVPPSIREAALGMGASRIQAMTHHVLPLALPGMLTGTIIGMAQALGETAPLLMIGMVAFIVDIPGGPTDPATVLPVQIFLWADAPERAFVERTSAAIMVLLGFLITMNMAAVFLRKKFETRW